MPWQAVSVTAGAPSDNTTLQAVLDAYAAEGFADSYDIGEDGRLTHRPTGEAEDLDDLEVVRLRRLEGASDPADMMLVVAVRSRHGGRQGVVLTPFGPNASEAQADVLARWQDELARAERS